MLSFEDDRRNVAMFRDEGVPVRLHPLGVLRLTGLDRRRFLALSQAIGAIMEVCATPSRPPSS